MLSGFLPMLATSRSQTAKASEGRMELLISGIKRRAEEAAFLDSHGHVLDYGRYVVFMNAEQ